jgi:hypothetical protein
MGEGDDEIVHNGGLPTTIVLRTVLFATVERSQSKKYKVQAWRVPSRAIREKVKGGRASSPCYIWNVACVMYPNMTIVTLGTTI